MTKSPYKRDGMFNGASHLIFEKANSLRKNMTDAEKTLWFYLKQNPEGFKFRRQHPLGIYIADFYCHKVKLVIELDGDIHQNPEVKINDDIRQRNIEQEGIKVIRFTNEEIYNDLKMVSEKIKSHLITK